jgi:hypothetical protein
MPAEAGIQYSETPTIESRTRGILDTRLRGYDGGGERGKPAERAKRMLRAGLVKADSGVRLKKLNSKACLGKVQKGCLQATIVASWQHRVKI